MVEGKDTTLMQLPVEEHILETWISSYIPNFDYYFLPEQEHNQSTFGQYGIILSRKDFFNNQFYCDFKTNCFLQCWRIPEDVHSILITDGRTADDFASNDFKQLLQYQIDFERNHIFNAVEFKNIRNSAYTSGNKVVLQRSLWDTWDEKLKRKYLSSYSETYVDNAEIDSETRLKKAAEFPHLAPYFDCFSSNHGANCFASVITAVSKDDTFITHWMNEENLLNLLSLNHFELFSTHLDDLESGDAVLFRRGGAFCHASYYLGSGIFFNKNGQECFNPWQLLDTDALFQEWGTDIHIFRRKR